MRTIVMALAASALVGLGFLLGRLPVEPKMSPEVRLASQPDAVSILDLVDDSPASPPSITGQAEEAQRRNEGGLAARNLRALAEKPGAHPSPKTLAGRAQAAAGRPEDPVGAMGGSTP